MRKVLQGGAFFWAKREEGGLCWSVFIRMCIWILRTK